MQDINRVAEEAKRVGHETQESARRIGQRFENAASTGFDAASRSLSEVNRGFQAIAMEVAEYSRRTFEDVVQAWEQLLRARSVTDVVDIQTRYAKKTYDTHVSELSRLTELYLGLTRSASKPVEQTGRRFSG